MRPYSEWQIVKREQHSTRKVIIRCSYVMVVLTSFAVLIFCYWNGLISDKECERVYSLADPEWRTQLEALQNKDINLVLHGRWEEYYSRQYGKVPIYVRPDNL